MVPETKLPEEAYDDTGCKLPVEILPRNSDGDLNRTRSIMIDEVRSQFDETLSVMSALIQKAAIIVAFSSVMLLKILDSEPSSFLWAASLAILTTDCMLGLCITLFGRHIAIGVNTGMAINRFYEGMDIALQEQILESKWLALDNLGHVSDTISRCVHFQIILTIVGFISVIGMVLCNVS